MNFSLFLSVRCISSHDNWPSVWPRAVGRIWSDDDDDSGVAGPLAARGGGQICRPFVIGFGNWRACLKYKSHVMSTVTLVGYTS